MAEVNDLHVDPEVLERVQRRVLWLATRMIDSANHDRPVPEGNMAVKVGGHQASSASMVSIMTALWFGHLSGDDKVAVKPHASPVYHSIKYLTGELDESYLTRLREMGGLQAYPSRTKDPDVADFSTGSVGLGAVAPLFAAMARRYIEAQFGEVTDRPARFIALVGDAELDEGNIWEAIADPALQGLGNVMWVVDANRQSLDRVIPDQKIKKLIEFFDGAGWHVVEVKYGTLLEEAFALPGGEELRSHVDAMENERYQSLFALRGSALRERFLGGSSQALREFIADVSDDDLYPLVTNLGGHDLAALLRAYRECDIVDDRPSVVFAYTVKGWGLPIAGDPLNHSALLSGEQIDALRNETDLPLEEEWSRFAPRSPEGVLCAHIGGELNNQPIPPRATLPIPDATGVLSSKAVSTQETFGRVLTSLANIEAVAARMVTMSPDVSVSTNLGGWINKMGVFAPEDRPDYFGADRVLRWEETSSGHHIELGISEMNLFLALHAFGLGHELHGQHLLPVGTVYDPFVCRGLDALIYALYNDARFVVAGTPAGVTLAPEGGAHQSSITPSIGLELPGLSYAEPAYARALDWLLCDGLQRLGYPDGGSLYLRLSTRQIDQGPFDAATERIGIEQLRVDVLAGGYRLLEPGGAADLVIAASGPVVPEAVEAAGILADEGVNVLLLDVTSSDRLYRGWRSEVRDAARHARVPEKPHQLANLLDASERHVPIVTVHDAASHHLAWLGSVFGALTVPIGVDQFGQSGSIHDLYEVFDFLPDQIANAAFVALAT
ncbi:MAG: pyruvate dehydrogenase [Actinobacteria bacterium]|nr:pyruvate dehydrogenase [Actinomycetota bacterium]